MSPLLSPWGKLRMALDLVLPVSRDEGDETLADFVIRRLGREALDKLAEPLMSGIFSAEADRQSLLATFPRFREMERTHSSLIRGILAAGRERRRAGQGTGDGKAPGHVPKPLPAFVTPVQGTAELIRRLAAAIRGMVRTGTAVTRLERVLEGGGFRLHLAGGTSVQASAVVLAVPAGVTGQLLGELAPQPANDLVSIRHVCT